MALETYNQKRNFDQTPEPRPHIAAATRRPIFVVQEHHASHLHYDFRLEADGVLKSWAVPKQPSVDPAMKRLAVQVEDHPLAYAKFSGTIPAGQYGAGVVTIWDKGTYENTLTGELHAQTITQGIEAGRVEVTLHGRKLKGGFVLVRMQRPNRKDHWLLIKRKDTQARAGSSESNTRTIRATSRLARRRTAVQSSDRSRPSAVSSEVRPSNTQVRAVTFTHEDKLMFPEVGLTKGDVLQFYQRIAPQLLPFMRDRPVTVERLPEGLAEKASPHFWQKHTPSYYPSWIPRVEITSETGKLVPYTLVNDRPTLLYLVNQGALTFHVWGSRTHSLERPDFILFDLDPGPAAFAGVVAVALQLHTILQAQRRASFVKTSGKSGLHVLTPWTQAGGYDEARDWALSVAQQVITELPDMATVEQRKDKRHRKVYIDVLQNARGHHAVPPYVLRPVPQATVSTPIAWRELTSEFNPQKFTLRTIFRRLARRNADPFAPLLKFFHNENKG